MPTGITSPSDQLLELQVQGDFVDRLTAARPVQAISELVWNALDAEATRVSIRLEETSVGTLNAIVIEDNGHGMKPQDAQALFINLGGSWKRDTRTLKTANECSMAKRAKVASGHSV